MKSSKHAYTQLDSLRGLASLQVMNQHLSLMAPVMLMDIMAFKGSANPLERFVFWLQYSPFHFLYMAYEAVVFFFVLSGFVLYSSLSKRVDLRIYGQYIIKRVFRLYLPVVAAILLSIICRSIFYNHKDMSTLSWWFKAMWNHPVGLAEFFELIIFRNRDFHNTVTSLWSIVIEIKISLLIPAFVFIINLLRRSKSADALWNIAIFAGTGYLFHHAVDYFMKDEDVLYSLFVMRFAFAFIAGIMLSKYLHYITHIVYNLSLPIVLLVVAIAFFYYGVDWFAGIVPQPLHFLVADGYHNELLILASCLFITISFNKRVSNFLNNKHLRHLGNLSFSLYLLHPVVLLVTTYLLADVLPLLAIWAIIIIASLLASHVFYTWFEMPVNNFGRMLAGKVLSKKSA